MHYSSHKTTQLDLNYRITEKNASTLQDNMMHYSSRKTMHLDLKKDTRITEKNASTLRLQNAYIFQQ
jgi:hypothetical protein